MLWIISAAAVAGIAAAGVFAALWMVEWRISERLCKELNNVARMLSDSYKDCEHWKHEACVHLERERAAVEQAKVFERVSKTMEEHVTAERGRADRLAAALSESEGKREQLGNKFKIVENALIQCEERLGKANGENKMLKRELDELRKSNGSANTSAAIDEREFANIMAYNGSDEGQVDLKNG